MEQQKKFDDLHEQFMAHIDDYVNAKKESIKEEDHSRVSSAKKEWQDAWLKLKEALMVLENIEI